MYADASPIVKLLIFIGVLLICTAAFSLAGLVLAPVIFGSDVVLKGINTSDFSNPQSVAALKFLQLFSQVGMMIIPSLLAAFIFSKNNSSFLNTNKITGALSLFLVVLLMLLSSPLINFLLEINSHLQLPSFLNSLENQMKHYEEEAAKLTKVFLRMENTSDLFINLLMIGLLPAIGEEFLFRGVIQKLVRELTGNIHVAIFLTAIFFSAIHLQFFGFLPRFLLGMLFGYLLYWSGSIWLPVLAHFVNNASAVMFEWFSQRNQLPFNPDTIGTASGESWILILSIALTFYLIFLLKSKLRQTFL